MNDEEISARLTGAMSNAVAEGELVSVTIEVLRRSAIARVETSPVRRTRTLVFMNAEAVNDVGEIVANANAVYKLRP